MARRDKRRRREPDIPVSSFSDIAFLLIIFFILATTLAQLSGVVTDIPAGQKAEAEVQTTANVELHNDVIRFNEQVVDIRGLRRELGMLNLHAKSGKDKVVLLEAVGKVNYQTYFDVMASISSAGGVTAIVREDDSSR
jgi:biopolymer transport protein ExbD